MTLNSVVSVLTLSIEEKKTAGWVQSTDVKCRHVNSDVIESTLRDTESGCHKQYVHK